jgi:hypothetical protein
MGQQTRNHSVTGVAVLAGAAMIAFGATQAWATGAVTLRGWVAGTTPHEALRFDRLLGPGGRSADVTPLLIGGAAVLGVSALLLFVTRVPVLGILWRLLALATVAGLGVTSVAAWSVVMNPTSVIADPDSQSSQFLSLGASVAQSSGLLDIKPALGLWLLTIGCGIAGIGALIPAIRGRTIEVETPAPSGLRRSSTGMSPGWYPDQLDGSFVRFFDGVQWTGATRPRS